jgi:hypothetical protein
MTDGFDLTCNCCGAVVSVKRLDSFGEDERKSFDCPCCNNLLFTWSHGAYDIARVIEQPTALHT